MAARSPCLGDGVMGLAGVAVHSASRSNGLYQCIPRAKRHRGLALLETMVDAEVNFLLSGLYPEDILPIHTDRLIQAVLRQEHPRAATPERLGA